MKPRYFRIALLIVILGFTVMACRAFSAIRQDVTSAQETIQLAATKIEEGQDLIGTARAFGTQVLGEGLGETAQALATQFEDSGMLETAQAFATQEGPSLLTTAMAVVTQQAPGAIATIQTLATESAQATPIPDIPLIEGNRDLYFQSNDIISYMTSLPYDQALDFYKTQMPANGWTKVDKDTFETGLAANLRFEKDSRQVSITISQTPGGNNTLILITLENK
jgi:hypothetical protein